jgi:hypothetical protein
MSISRKVCFHWIYFNMAVPWLRRLVVGLSQRRTEFAHGLLHVGFLVDEVALAEVCLRDVGIFPVSIILRGSIYRPHLGDKQ